MSDVALTSLTVTPRPGPASVTHRAVLLERLYTAGVVVVDAAGRLTLLGTVGGQDGLDARVGPHTRRVLGAQVDQVALQTSRSKSQQPKE